MPSSRPLAAAFILLVWAAVAAHQTADEQIALEIRIFDGPEEVTAESRIRIYRAGERTMPVDAAPPGPGRGVMARVPPGLYDVQAIRERQGRVVGIRWAERLVVMHYPDEAGRHLEVVNLRPGFGALQIRRPPGRTGGPLRARIFAPGTREPAGQPAPGEEYVLFVVPAGTYDVALQDTGEETVWSGIDVPPERTRLRLTP
jgi:hypothetical protein